MFTSRFKLVDSRYSYEPVYYDQLRSSPALVCSLQRDYVHRFHISSPQRLPRSLALKGCHVRRSRNLGQVPERRGLLERQEG